LNEARTTYTVSQPRRPLCKHLSQNPRRRNLAVTGSGTLLPNALVTHIICIIQIAARHKRCHSQTQMERWPILRKTERPGKLSLSLGYVRNHTKVAAVSAKGIMPPCGHRRCRGSCHPHLLLAAFSSTLEMEVTGSSKMRPHGVRHHNPNFYHHQNLESESAARDNLVSLRESRTTINSNASF
jgi:hypothetical protein